MNQGLFKLVFNACTRMLTPTWEGAPARGKQSSAASACGLTIALLLFAHPVLANPSNPTVVNGVVGFDTTGNTLTITNSPNAIINWQGFSINAGEITRFIQQNGASAVLNRVTGQDPSKILGTLQSNGRVFLINPNGITFGQGATIDVGGLIASTLKLSDADFLAGKYKFTDGANAGAVKNEGTINTAAGGQVYLIAPDIQNNGIITSPKGEIVLAAGHSVSLVDPKNPEIVVSLSAPATQAINVGQLIAQGGSIGIYAGLVKQAGIVNADSASVDESGRIFLKGTHTTILGENSVTSASNSEGNGGEIIVTAPKINVEANANVDASGQTGGGTILIGGDAHGVNPDIPNAKNTSVAAGAKFKADAIASGNGGKVVVWADRTTRFAGHASARGGAQGGNGGFVEVSGKGYLDFKGTVDTRAPLGQRGTLLLDPTNITIGTVADIDGNAQTGDDIIGAADLNDAATDFAAANSFITASALSSLLGTTDVELAATNDITVDAAVNWNSANSLSLFAENNLTVNAGISNMGSGGLTFDVGNKLNVNANIRLAGGALNVMATRANFNAGTTTMAASAFFNGGMTTFNTGSTYNVSGLTEINNATVNFNESVSISDLNLFEGSIGGTGDLTITGAFDWAGGNIANGGLLTTRGVTTVQRGGGSASIARDWNNTGRVELIGGIVLRGARFTNQAGGEVNIAAGSGIFGRGGQGSFINAGTLNFDPNANTRNTLEVLLDSPTFAFNILNENATIGVLFDNNGTVNVRSGELIFSAGNTETGTDTGIYNVDAGAILGFTGGTRTIVANGATTATGSDAIAGEGLVMFGPSASVNFEGAGATSAGVPLTLRVDRGPIVPGSIIQPANGTVVANLDANGEPDGTFTYTPNAGFSGVDNFSYVVDDSGQFPPPITGFFALARSAKLVGDSGPGFITAQEFGNANIVINVTAPPVMVSPMPTMSTPPTPPPDPTLLSATLGFSPLPNTGSGSGANNSAGTNNDIQSPSTFNALLESAPSAAIGLDGFGNGALADLSELYLSYPFSGDDRDARLFCR